ncbi:uncharacterized protein LOC126837384 [Adelges cooleyi]|uniref:uncharacterized protein LOC126837384 n=1 Tax=Adelges cooleyi TaxID=133065 RepID=UPI00217F65C1|nr:uncharacterized protein LOC126837384 [Adelges cooleyi]
MKCMFIVWLVVCVKINGQATEFPENVLDVDSLGELSARELIWTAMSSQCNVYYAVYNNFLNLGIPVGGTAIPPEDIAVYIATTYDPVGKNLVLDIRQDFETLREASTTIEDLVYGYETGIPKIDDNQVVGTGISIWQKVNRAMALFNERMSDINNEINQQLLEINNNMDRDSESYVRAMRDLYTVAMEQIIEAVMEDSSSYVAALDFIVRYNVETELHNLQTRAQNRFQYDAKESIRQQLTELYKLYIEALSYIYNHDQMIDGSIWTNSKFIIWFDVNTSKTLADYLASSILMVATQTSDYIKSAYKYNKLQIPNMLSTLKEHVNLNLIDITELVKIPFQHAIPTDHESTVYKFYQLESNKIDTLIKDRINIFKLQWTDSNVAMVAKEILEIYKNNQINKLPVKDDNVIAWMYIMHLEEQNKFFVKSASYAMVIYKNLQNSVAYLLQDQSNRQQESMYSDLLKHIDQRMLIVMRYIMIPFNDNMISIPKFMNNIVDNSNNVFNILDGANNNRSTKAMSNWLNKKIKNTNEVYNLVQTASVSTEMLYDVGLNKIVEELEKNNLRDDSNNSKIINILNDITITKSICEKSMVNLIQYITINKKYIEKTLEKNSDIKIEAIHQLAKSIKHNPEDLTDILYDYDGTKPGSRETPLIISGLRGLPDFDSHQVLNGGLDTPFDGSKQTDSPEDGNPRYDGLFGSPNGQTSDEYPIINSQKTTVNEELSIIISDDGTKPGSRETPPHISGLRGLPDFDSHQVLNGGLDTPFDGSKQTDSPEDGNPRYDGLFGSPNGQTSDEYPRINAQKTTVNEELSIVISDDGTKPGSRETPPIISGLRGLPDFDSHQVLNGVLDTPFDGSKQTDSPEDGNPRYDGLFGSPNGQSSDEYPKINAQKTTVNEELSIIISDDGTKPGSRETPPIISGLRGLPDFDSHQVLNGVLDTPFDGSKQTDSPEDGNPRYDGLFGSPNGQTSDEYPIINAQKTTVNEELSIIISDDGTKPGSRETPPIISGLRGLPDFDSHQVLNGVLDTPFDGSKQTDSPEDGNPRYDGLFGSPNGQTSDEYPIINAQKTTVNEELSIIISDDGTKPGSRETPPIISGLRGLPDFDSHQVLNGVLDTPFDGSKQTDSPEDGNPRYDGLFGSPNGQTSDEYPIINSQKTTVNEELSIIISDDGTKPGSRETPPIISGLRGLPDFDSHQVLNGVLDTPFDGSKQTDSPEDGSPRYDGLFGSPNGQTSDEYPIINSQKTTVNEELSIVISDDGTKPGSRETPPIISGLRGLPDFDSHQMEIQRYDGLFGSPNGQTSDEYPIINSQKTTVNEELSIVISDDGTKPGSRETPPIISGLRGLPDFDSHQVLNGVLDTPFDGSKQTDSPEDGNPRYDGLFGSPNGQTSDEYPIINSQKTTVNEELSIVISDDGTKPGSRETPPIISGLRGLPDFDSHQVLNGVLDTPFDGSKQTDSPEDGNPRYDGLFGSPNGQTSDEYPIINSQKTTVNEELSIVISDDGTKPGSRETPPTISGLKVLPNFESHQVLNGVLDTPFDGSKQTDSPEDGNPRYDGLFGSPNGQTSDEYPIINSQKTTVNEELSIVISDDGTKPGSRETPPIISGLRGLPDFDSHQVLNGVLDTPFDGSKQTDSPEDGNPRYDGLFGSPNGQTSDEYPIINSQKTTVNEELSIVISDDGTKPGSRETPPIISGLRGLPDFDSHQVLNGVLDTPFDGSKQTDSPEDGNPRYDGLFGSPNGQTSDEYPRINAQKTTVNEELSIVISDDGTKPGSRETPPTISGLRGLPDFDSHQVLNGVLDTPFDGSKQTDSPEDGNPRYDGLFGSPNGQTSDEYPIINSQKTTVNEELSIVISDDGTKPGSRETPPTISGLRGLPDFDSHQVLNGVLDTPFDGSKQTDSPEDGSPRYDGLFDSPNGQTSDEYPKINAQKTTVNEELSIIISDDGTKPGSRETPPIISGLRGLPDFDSHQVLNGVLDTPFDGSKQTDSPEDGNPRYDGLFGSPNGQSSDEYPKINAQKTTVNEELSIIISDDGTKPGSRETPPIISGLRGLPDFDSHQVLNGVLDTPFDGSKQTDSPEDGNPRYDGLFGSPNGQTSDEYPIINSQKTTVNEELSIVISDDGTKPGSRETPPIISGLRGLPDFDSHQVLNGVLDTPFDGSKQTDSPEDGNPRYDGLFGSPNGQTSDEYPIINSQKTTVNEELSIVISDDGTKPGSRETPPIISGLRGLPDFDSHQVLNGVLDTPFDGSKQTDSPEDGNPRYDGLFGSPNGQTSDEYPIINSQKTTVNEELSIVISDDGTKPGSRETPPIISGLRGLPDFDSHQVLNGVLDTPFDGSKQTDSPEDGNPRYDGLFGSPNGQTSDEYPIINSQKTTVNEELSIVISDDGTKPGSRETPPIISGLRGLPDFDSHQVLNGVLDTPFDGSKQTDSPEDGNPRYDGLFGSPNGQTSDEYPIINSQKTTVNEELSIVISDDGTKPGSRETLPIISGLRGLPDFDSHQVLNGVLDTPFDGSKQTDSPEDGNPRYNGLFDSPNGQTSDEYPIINSQKTTVNEELSIVISDDGTKPGSRETPPIISGLRGLPDFDSHQVLNGVLDTPFDGSKQTDSPEDGNPRYDGLFGSPNGQTSDEYRRINSQKTTVNEELSIVISDDGTKPGSRETPPTIPGMRALLNSQGDFVSCEDFTAVSDSGCTDFTYVLNSDEYTVLQSETTVQQVVSTIIQD